jgi:hypothetical protein
MGIPEGVGGPEELNPLAFLQWLMFSRKKLTVQTYFFKLEQFYYVVINTLAKNKPIFTVFEISNNNHFSFA